MWMRLTYRGSWATVRIGCDRVHQFSPEIFWLARGQRERKIIVITGKTGHELAPRTLKSGAIDFLSKPLDYEALGRSLTIARAITYPSA